MRDAGKPEQKNNEFNRSRISDCKENTTTHTGSQPRGLCLVKEFGAVVYDDAVISLREVSGKARRSRRGLGKACVPCFLWGAG